MTRLFVQSNLPLLSPFTFLLPSHLCLHPSGLSSQAILGLHPVLDLRRNELCIVYQPIIVDVIVLEDRIHQELQLRILQHVQIINQYILLPTSYLKYGWKMVAVAIMIVFFWNRVI